MIDYTAILSRHYSGCQWTLNGDAYEGLEWLDTTQKPSQEELDALWPSVQSTIQNEYTESLRKNAYISISDPLFFKWQRGEATQQEWLDAVAKIKSDYPYGQ